MTKLEASEWILWGSLNHITEPHVPPLLSLSGKYYIKYLLLLSLDLRMGITAPILIFSGIITASNSLLGKSNSYNFPLLLEKLTG